ncbi:sporulation protein YqfD [Effusibacillus dendaii]|uniref:Sporulation protein YqfD n=1 Tax=Effusibacillus dendaii TaxID=2743772 RepID=A0A7I8DA35_9BACL|nr:sporulation protein YqfD [Effusibacillus dendaii]BCJ86222.1 sporulation protein YqfD [Effusibacillus dendaii]
MLSRFLIDFYEGYVVVNVTGNRLPSLVNLANQEGLWIRDIVYRANGSIQMTILRSDIRRLIPLLRQTNSKIHFGKRTGLPFLWQRAWRRKMFLAGAVLFLGLLYTLTSLVWSVEVEGTKKISPETVLAAADSIGIHRGTWIAKLPEKEVLREQIMDKVPELSWVGVSIQGTHVRIRVVEKIPAVKPLPSNPQNIIAMKKGIIERVLVQKGIPTVQKGQLVNPGDLVISGSLGDGKTSVHAQGVVEARIWYTTQLTIPLNQVRKRYTGEQYAKEYLVFGSLPVQVWGYRTNTFSTFEEQADDQELRIGSYKLPVTWRHVNVKETAEDRITLTADEAKKEALTRSSADVAAKIGETGRIVSQKVLHERIERGNLYIKVLTEAIEDIGKSQPF